MDIVILDSPCKNQAEILKKNRNHAANNNKKKDMLKDQKIYNNKIQTDRKNESIENCIPCPRILIKNKEKSEFFLSFSAR